jgi:hypothetical protein
VSSFAKDIVIEKGGFLMNRSLPALILGALVVAPCAGQAQQTSMMAPSAYGAGPHGYDLQVGTWSCSNNMAGGTGGPNSQTLTVTPIKGKGVIFYRSTAQNFDLSWYYVYSSKTKSWLSPFIASDGSYGSESTAQTGKRVVWTGSTIDGSSGKKIQIRDTIVNSATKTTDLGEWLIAGKWKAQYNLTCTRT